MPRIHLIIQGVDVETADLKRIAKLVSAQGIEQIASQVFRLKAAEHDSRVPALCEEAKLDYAYVPEERRLADFRLLVMDMDSTLIHHAKWKQRVARLEGGENVSLSVPRPHLQLVLGDGF